MTTPEHNEAGQPGGQAHGPRGPTPPGPCRAQVAGPLETDFYSIGVSYTKDQVLFQNGFHRDSLGLVEAIGIISFFKAGRVMRLPKGAANHWRIFIV